jgi:uncharacterized integral membrane protein (TIGR00698 family)
VIPFFNSLSPTTRKIIFFVFVAFCLTPYIDPPLALLLGLIVAQTIGNPFNTGISKYTSLLLKISVIGLGFGVNLGHALQAGKEGFLFTVFSIVMTLLLGYMLGKLLKVDQKISYLLSGGTAICGGSAIAALSPIIKADDKQISVALGTVFILNSVALFLFPPLGHLLDMTEHQFGLWSAIAIHDTSSVVGAAAKFGSEALQVATTVKLERALWIIPLSLFTAFITKGENKRISIPYFIGLFVVAMCISTWLPEFTNVYSGIVSIARKGLTVTLFLIGAGLSVKTIRAVGIRPLIQGISLWAFISIISLVSVLWFG